MIRPRQPGSLGRSHLVCFVLLSVVFLTACSRAASPTEVLKHLHAAYAQGDLVSIQSLVTEEKAELINEPPSDFVKAQAAQDEITRSVEVVQGSEAKVTYTMTSVDLNEIFKEVGEAQAEGWRTRSGNPLYQNPKESGDANGMPELLAAIAAPDAPKLQGEYEAHLRKEDGRWKVHEVLRVR